MNNFLGKFGEFLALILLKSKLYKILSRNFRSKQGEIDIIAIKNNTLIFVEVKFRSKIGTFDQPVHFTQINRIKKTANFYLLKNKLYNKGFDIRFDLIIIRNLFNLKHYVNVW